MQTRYIPALTMLVAGAVTGILCIINKYDNLSSLKILFIVLIIFYMIGILAKKIIIKTMNSAFLTKEKNQEEVPEEEPLETKEEL